MEGFWGESPPKSRVATISTIFHPFSVTKLAGTCIGRELVKHH